MTTSQQNSNSNASQTANQTGNTVFSNQTNPWAPSQGLLSNLLGNIGGNPVGVTQQQTSALDALQNSLQGLPNFANAGTKAARQFLGGDPTGLLYPGNQQLQQTLSPIANQPLNPLQSPIVQQLLSNIQQQVTTGTNANAAAAGRSLNSGDNTAAMSYGLASAELPQLLGQYNANQQNVLNAGNSRFSGNFQTAGAGAGNIGQGLNIAQMIPGLASQNALAQLSAANTRQALPFQNVGAAENLTIPIAGLGGTSSGGQNTTGNASQIGNTQTQSTFTPSLLQDALAFGGLLGGNSGLLGGLTNFGPAVSSLNAGASGIASLFKS